MAALTCNAQALSLAAGKINQFTKKEKQALLILYLYRQLNPASTGVIPAASLLSDASCLSCSTGRGGFDELLDSFEVWIQRNAAIDAGLPGGTFNANTARAHITPLVNLDSHKLRAIEICLRAKLS